MGELLRGVGVVEEQVVEKEDHEEIPEISLNAMEGQ